MSCRRLSVVTLYLSLCFITVHSLSWLTQPRDTSVAKGGTVKLFCEVQDRGSNVVTWSKGTTVLFVNNNQMDSSLTRYSIEGEFNLKIVNAQESDDDKYSCTVQNLGAETATVSVLVAPSQPKLLLNDSRTTYVEGDHVSLTCESTGANPAPTFRWTKSNSTGMYDIGVEYLLSENSQAKVKSSSQVVIPMEYYDHSSTFTCQVFNDINSNAPLMVSHDVLVFFKPIISFLPYSPYNVLKGTTVQLECKVLANPSPTDITWRKGGQTLSSSGGILNFSRVSETDSGEYSCTASNTVVDQIKSDTRSMQMHVLYAPVVTVPMATVVNVTGAVSIVCNVQANPPATVQWAKVDNSLMSSGPFLNLSEVKVSAMGNYSCTASNVLHLSGQSPKTERTSSFAMLYVQYKPGSASIGHYSPASVGQPITLTCKINNPGYPTPSFEWRKGNILIPSTQSSSLTIPSASLSDIGQYSCLGVNIMGRGTPYTMQVDVFEPLNFVTTPPTQDTILKNNTGYFLTCKVSGRPQPQVTWYKDGLPIDKYGGYYLPVTTFVMEADYRFVVTSKLYLNGEGRPSTHRNNLLITDIGNYTCRVNISETNLQEERTTELLILLPPQTDTNQKVATLMNNTAQLTCVGEGYPTMSFSWYKESSLLTSGGRYTIAPPSHTGVTRATSVLGIQRVEMGDLADYRCVVSNNLGNAEKIVNLVVKGPPDAPHGMNFTSRTWESVLLSWQPGFDGGDTQTFHVTYSSLPQSSHGVYNLTVGGGNQFNITGLLPDTTYSFAVFASNAFGVGDYSEGLKVITEVLEFPIIRNVPVFTVEDGTLTLDLSVNASYCLRIKYSRDAGRSWSTLVVQNMDCFEPSQESYALGEEGINRVNVSLCLRNRQQVCGAHVAAEIKPQSSTDLTQEQVIIIGCVCAAILIVLLCILVYIICRRRMRSAKEYENNVQANRTAAALNQGAPAKPKRALDQPDAAPTPNIFSVQHNYNNGHMTNGPTNHSNHSNGHVPLDTSYDSQLEKRMIENEMNRRNENMNNEYYNNGGDPGHKELHFSGEEKKGEMGSLQSQESGYNTPDPAKPKKFCGIMRLRQSPYLTEYDHVAHDPPGHTCSLPCCNADLRVEMATPLHRPTGCVILPFMQTKHIQGNFILRQPQKNLLIGRPSFTISPASLHIDRSANRKKIISNSKLGIPFGESNTDTDSVYFGHETLEKQGNFLTGRDITLPKNFKTRLDEWSGPLKLSEYAFGESLDNFDSSDSETEPDFDSAYYSSTSYYEMIEKMQKDISSNRMQNSTFSHHEQKPQPVYHEINVAALDKQENIEKRRVFNSKSHSLPNYTEKGYTTLNFDHSFLTKKSDYKFKNQQSHYTSSSLDFRKQKSLFAPVQIEASLYEDSFSSGDDDSCPAPKIIKQQPTCPSKLGNSNIIMIKTNNFVNLGDKMFNDTDSKTKQYNEMNKTLTSPMPSRKNSLESISETFQCDLLVGIHKSEFSDNILPKSNQLHCFSKNKINEGIKGKMICQSCSSKGSELKCDVHVSELQTFASKNGTLNSSQNQNSTLVDAEEKTNTLTLKHIDYSLHALPPQPHIPSQKNAGGNDGEELNAFTQKKINYSLPAISVPPPPPPPPPPLPKRNTAEGVKQFKKQTLSTSPSKNIQSCINLSVELKMYFSKKNMNCEDTVEKIQNKEASILGYHLPHRNNTISHHKDLSLAISMADTSHRIKPAIAKKPTFLCKSTKAISETDKKTDREVKQSEGKLCDSSHQNRPLPPIPQKKKYKSLPKGMASDKFCSNVKQKSLSRKTMTIKGNATVKVHGLEKQGKNANDKDIFDADGEESSTYEYFSKTKMDRTKCSKKVPSNVTLIL